MPTQSTARTVNEPKQERSRLTHQAILDATMECLIRHGYAGTSFQRVADIAKLSKGGVHQRFPAKHLLVVEALQNYLDGIRALTEGATLADLHKRPILARCVYCVEHTWRVVSSPKYLALNEVWSAARSDEQLRVALTPVVEHDFAYSEFKYLFPEIENNDAYKYITDIVICSLEGWALDGHVLGNLNENTSRLEFLSSLMAQQITEKCA